MHIYLYIYVCMYVRMNIYMYICNDPEMGLALYLCDEKWWFPRNTENKISHVLKSILTVKPHHFA